MPENQARSRDPKLGFFIKNYLRIFPKTKMLKIGRKSRFVYLGDINFPEKFVDRFGQIHEPLISMLSEWILRHGLKILEIQGIPIDLVISLGIKHLMKNR